MAPETTLRFPSACRLTRTAELDAVRREGKRFRTTFLEVRFLVSLSLQSRIGIVVPRHKQSAVARNKVKRRLRELSRTTLRPVLDTTVLDVVLRAAPEAYDADYDVLAADVQRVAARLGKTSA